MRSLPPIVSTVSHRVWTSLTTFPPSWLDIAAITAVTTATAGVGAVATGFIRPVEDFAPPPDLSSMMRQPLGAFIVPGLAEELLWRAALLPTPAEPLPLKALLFFRHAAAAATPVLSTAANVALFQTAAVVLVLHVCSHPIFSATFYPRGKEVFSDGRFLFLATIVLGGATLSYIVSGGSVWAAALTHGLPVALWRDFFGGESMLQGSSNSNDTKGNE